MKFSQHVRFLLAVPSLLLLIWLLFGAPPLAWLSRLPVAVEPRPEHSAAQTLDLPNLQTSYKTVSSTRAVPGGNLTYAIVLSNSGRVAAQVTVTDTLPSEIRNGVLLFPPTLNATVRTAGGSADLGQLVSPGVFVFSGSPKLIWQGQMPAQRQESLLLHVYLDVDLPVRGTFINTARIDDGLEIMERSSAASSYGTPLRVYLPVVVRGTLSDACLFGPPAAAIETFLLTDSQQQHANLRCNPTLAQVAQERAEDMANRGYFNHVTPEGFGPNYLVEAAGYVLPDFYDSSPSANNIESISAGRATAETTWAAWIDNPGYADHLLGRNDFFALQDEYGIGYAFNPSSPFQHYWVVIIAQQAGATNRIAPPACKPVPGPVQPVCAR